MNDEFQTESIFSEIPQVVQIFQYISMPPDKKKKKKPLQSNPFAKKNKNFSFRVGILTGVKMILPSGYCELTLMTTCHDNVCNKLELKEQ